MAFELTLPDRFGIGYASEQGLIVDQTRGSNEPEVSSVFKRDAPAGMNSRLTM